jgi:uncharacterized protein (DUF3084 family)
MEQEIAIALITLGGTIAGAGVYATRKWSDAKATVITRESEMQKAKQQHEIGMEGRRLELENARIERDRQTAVYIATNTEVIRAVQENLDKLTSTIQNKLGNGMTGIMRDSADMLVQHNMVVLAKMDSIQASVEKLKEMLEKSQLG